MGTALFHKLLNKCIGGNFYRIIVHTLYSASVCAVKQSNVNSYYFPTIANRGVKQKDNLSPTLF